MKSKILKALSFNRVAYDAVKEKFRRGMCENDIKKIILTACCDANDFSGDIVAGVRASQIEGDATDYTLKDGDCLILDLQFKCDGVWSDTTRTFFVGQPGGDVKNAYEKCLAAKKAGEKVLKNGVAAGRTYDAVKDALSPFRENFPHHAGHLFGVEKLMQPQFVANNETLVHTNDFVTLEPGVYFKDRFGVRIEDNYVITDNGFENLFDYPLQLEYFII